MSNTLFDIKVMENGNGSGAFRDKVIIAGHWDDLLDALDIITERVMDEYFVSEITVGDKVVCDKFQSDQVGEVADIIENGYILIAYEDGTACVVPKESVIKA